MLINKYKPLLNVLILSVQNKKKTGLFTSNLEMRKIVMSMKPDKFIISSVRHMHMDANNCFSVNPKAHHNFNTSSPNNTCEGKMFSMVKFNLHLTVHATCTKGLKF